MASIVSYLDTHPTDNHKVNYDRTSVSINAFKAGFSYSKVNKIATFQRAKCKL